MELRIKWLLIALAGIVCLMLLVVVIGALLPQDHHDSRTVTCHQPAEMVWNLISEPPNWRPDVIKYQELSPHNGHRMWSETDKHNQTITYEAIKSVPPRRLATRIADKTLPSAETWTYEISPEAATAL